MRLWMVIGLVLALPGGAHAACTVEQIRALSDAGALETVRRGCDVLAQHPELTLAGPLAGLCAADGAQLDALCAMTPDGRDAALDDWRGQVGRAQAFAAAWSARFASLRGCTVLDSQRAGVRERLAPACAVEVSKREAWQRMSAEVLALGRLDAYTPEAEAATVSVLIARAEAAVTPIDGASRSGLAVGAAAWAPALSNALAGFVAARLEAELDAFVVARIDADLCGDEAVAWAIEHTCALMRDGGGEVFATGFGGAFQASIEADVRALPDAALRRGVIDALSGRVALALLSSLRRGEPIGAAIGRLVALVEAAAPDAPDRRALREGLVTVEVVHRCLAAARAGAGGEGRCEALGRLVLRGLGDDAPTAAQLGALVTLVEALRRLDDDADRIGALVEGDADPAALGARLRLARQSLWSAATRALGAIGAVSPNAPPVWTAPPDLVDALTALERGSLPEALVAITRLLDESGAALPDGARALLAFGVDLHAAESSDEARAVIDAFAAPVGSWRLKRADRFVTSLGALAGVSSGVEWLNGGAVTGSDAGLVYGLSAPVGLDLSFGLGDWTLGAFVSLVDIGGLITVRHTAATTVEVEGGSSRDAEADALPEFDVRQLLAPGVLARVGLGASPFVLGAGAVLAPYARDVVIDGATSEDDVTAVRLLVVLGVDVPIVFF